MSSRAVVVDTLSRVEVGGSTSNILAFHRGQGTQVDPPPSPQLLIYEKACSPIVRRNKFKSDAIQS